VASVIEFHHKPSNKDTTADRLTRQRNNLGNQLIDLWQTNMVMHTKVDYREARVWDHNHIARNKAENVKVKIEPDLKARNTQNSI